MLGRFFGRLTGGNWRPPEQELAFASSTGFDTVQIRSDRPGEMHDELGVDPETLGALFDDNGVEPVLEMLVRHEGDPGTFARALRANLPAIESIGFLRVHIHPVGPSEAAPLLGRRDPGDADDNIDDDYDDYFYREPPAKNRKRSGTAGSGDTSDSFRSRGDLFPSDEEGEEDAVPLDDEEFTIALDKVVDDRGSNKTRSSSGGGVSET